MKVAWMMLTQAAHFKSTFVFCICIMTLCTLYIVTLYSKCAGALTFERFVSSDRRLDTRKEG